MEINDYVDVLENEVTGLKNKHPKFRDRYIQRDTAIE